MAACRRNGSLPEYEADEPVENSSKKILEMSHQADTAEPKSHVVLIKVAQKLEGDHQLTEDKEMIYSELLCLRYNHRRCSGRIIGEKHRMHRLEIALASLQSVDKTVMRRHSSAYLNVNNCNGRNSYCRVVHKSKSLAEERKFLRDIYEKKEPSNICSSRDSPSVMCTLYDLRGVLNYRPENSYLKQYSKDLHQYTWARNRYIPYNYVEGMTLDSLVSREIMESAIKVIKFELEKMRDDLVSIIAKIRRAEKKLKRCRLIDNDVNKLQKKLIDIQLKKGEAYGKYAELMRNQ